MLYTTLFVAAASFAGFASAQNQTFDTPIPCCSVPVNQVNPTSLRSTWCEANQNTCVDLCGGQSKIGINGNTCDSSTLSFTCKCTNGTDVSSSMRNYQQSVPGLMCRYWHGLCINATGTNAAQQFGCNQALNSCGNLTTKGGADASSSAPATASRTSGGSSSPSGSSTAGASGAAPSTPGAAAGLVQYSTPILAAGLLVVFGIAM
ncbi:hypothetical protein GQ44DRAFT_325133 [Phaeosphaeriaceae sp. PMI808]|nr:hypothetical protein GQ44DRAFT_325133 [Phaeosphaeriaceae sp. PMI808]